MFMLRFRAHYHRSLVLVVGAVFKTETHRMVVGCIAERRVVGNRAVRRDMVGDAPAPTLGCTGQHHATLHHNTLLVITVKCTAVHYTMLDYTTVHFTTPH